MIDAEFARHFAEGLLSDGNSGTAEAEFRQLYYDTYILGALPEFIEVDGRKLDIFDQIRERYPDLAWFIDTYRPKEKLAS